MFVCLGFGHFILFVFFFLGREAQKVREWGVNSLKTSIFPLPTPLRGCRSFLEIVFQMGRQFFKNVDFSVTYPLKVQLAGLFFSYKLIEYG